MCGSEDYYLQFNHLGWGNLWHHIYQLVPLTEEQWHNGMISDGDPFGAAITETILRAAEILCDNYESTQLSNDDPEYGLSLLPDDVADTYLDAILPRLQGPSANTVIVYGSNITYSQATAFLAFIRTCEHGFVVRGPLFNAAGILPHWENPPDESRTNRITVSCDGQKLYCVKKTYTRRGNDILIGTEEVEGP